MFRKITRQKLDKFMEAHATDVRVLDIGSGGSAYGAFFPNRLCVDIDPQRKPDVVGDAHRLPFSDGEFSLVLCTEVLEHLHDPRTAVSEMRRVLTDDGKVILTTRFLFPVHDAPGDLFRYTEFGLRELFKEFKIIELKAETKNFSTLAVLLQRMVLQSTFVLDKPVKLVLLFFVKALPIFDRFVRRQYGDIKKSHEVDHIMASGYYIVAQK